MCSESFAVCCFLQQSLISLENLLLEAGNPQEPLKMKQRAGERAKLLKRAASKKLFSNLVGSNSRCFIMQSLILVFVLVYTTCRSFYLPINFYFFFSGPDKKPGPQVLCASFRLLLGVESDKLNTKGVHVDSPPPFFSFSCCYCFDSYGIMFIKS